MDLLLNHWVYISQWAWINLYLLRLYWNSLTALIRMCLISPSLLGGDRGMGLRALGKICDVWLLYLLYLKVINLNTPQYHCWCIDVISPFVHIFWVLFMVDIFDIVGTFEWIWRHINEHSLRLSWMASLAEKYYYDR